MKWFVFEDNMCGCGGLDGRPKILETKEEAEAYIKKHVLTYPRTDESSFVLMHGEIIEEGRDEKST